MASVGHAMIGIAAARLARANRPPTAPPPWSAVTDAAIWAGLALLPDIDVVGFRLGVSYAAALGHRGATHSFMFAALVGAVLWLLTKLSSAPRSPLRMGILAAAVVATHPILDTLTDGGLGCALWWPFDTRRVFAPWTPLPVAPIGRAFLSRAGLQVALLESIVFAPFLVWGLVGLCTRDRRLREVPPC